ncbi:MAG: hypothetical protein QM496_02085 [Verrucomicrobiota bacterium]
MKIPIHLKSNPRVLTQIVVFALLFLSPSLFAQAKKPANSKVVEQQPSAQVGILIEYFKLDHRAANKLIHKFSSKASNAQELRDILGEMTKKNEAELFETGWVRCRSGQRAKTESIREDIDPSRYAHPEIQNVVDDTTAIKEENAPTPIKVDQPPKQTPVQKASLYMTAATPTDFKTKHVGLTLEVDPVIMKGNKIIDLSLSTEIITRLPDLHFTRPGFESTARGIENISMPSFYTMKTITRIKAIPGNYNLLAIHTPHDEPNKRIMVLLKTDLFLAR